MSSVFSSIGNALGSVFKTLGGSGGLGTGISRAAGIGLGVPSLISQWQQAGQENRYINDLLELNSQYATNQTNYENAINAHLNKLVNTTPQQEAQQVAAMTQPLNDQLVQGVSNPVQAYLAERGLAQAPGVQAQTLAQALAPFEQQNIQTAQQGWLGLNQLPFYAYPPTPPPGASFPTPAGFQGIYNLLAGPIPGAAQRPQVPLPLSNMFQSTGGLAGTPLAGTLQPQSSDLPGILTQPLFAQGQQ